MPDRPGRCRLLTFPVHVRTLALVVPGKEPHSIRSTARVVTVALRRAVLLTFVLVAACGKTDGEPVPAPATTPARGDTGSVAEDTLAPPEPAPVALPRDFPADFPIPPGATVLAADARPGAAGLFASARLRTSQSPAEVVAWYGGSLSDTGWTVTEVPRGAARALHAEQGESYVDLSAVASADTIDGGSEVRVELWKAGR